MTNRLEILMIGLCVTTAAMASTPSLGVENCSPFPQCGPSNGTPGWPIPANPQQPAAPVDVDSEVRIDDQPLMAPARSQLQRLMITHPDQSPQFQPSIQLPQVNRQ